MSQGIYMPCTIQLTTMLLVSNFNVQNNSTVATDPGVFY